MRVVCPSCDVAPDAGAAAGAACAACGARLVAVASDEDLIGTIVDGRFEIVAVLGKGGMGTVYRANQRSIGREVALKLLDARYDRSVDAVKRFMREAKLASQLAHPNTVGVVEFGQNADGRLYLAMELVRGKTLFDIVRAEGALALARVSRIGVQLVDALEAAHALSIVHRDLKLENAMLLDAPAGRDLVKILDFGLARSFTEDESSPTKTGMLAGTPRYLAPEVLEGAQAAPAQDLYALGVMLGEMATGRALWDEPTLERLFHEKLAGEPKLDGMDAELRALVEALLARAPAARPPHAEIRRTLLALEGRGSAAAKARASTPIALEATSQQIAQPAAEPAAPASAAFKGPAGDDPRLELEPEWVKARQAKFAAAAPAAHKRHRALAIGIALVVLGGFGVVIAIVASRPAQPHHDYQPRALGSENDDTVLGRTVSIEIRSKHRAALRLDGVAVGTTPKILHVPRGGQPRALQAIFDGHAVYKEVIPDHDQVIDLAP